MYSVAGSSLGGVPKRSRVIYFGNRSLVSPPPSPHEPSTNANRQGSRLPFFPGELQPCQSFCALINRSSNLAADSQATTLSSPIASGWRLSSRSLYKKIQGTAIIPSTGQQHESPAKMEGTKFTGGHAKRRRLSNTMHDNHNHPSHLVQLRFRRHREHWETPSPMPSEAAAGILNNSRTA